MPTAIIAIAPARIAHLVNGYYVDMGEGEAVAALKSLASSKPQENSPDRTQTRMAFVCRVLFGPKGKEPMREPLFGGLADLPKAIVPLVCLWNCNMRSLTWTSVHANDSSR